MRKVSLYSRSIRPAVEPPNSLSGSAPDALPLPEGETAVRPNRNWRAWPRRHAKPLLFLMGGVIAFALITAHGALKPPARQFTQEDIDKAVLHTLETKTLPSTAAKAYEKVRPSIVRVRQLKSDDDGDHDIEKSVGTGVVIVDKGIILTNLHVVAGAERVGVVFFDGTESEATVIGTQPEND